MDWLRRWLGESAALAAVRAEAAELREQVARQTTRAAQAQVANATLLASNNTLRATIAELIEPATVEACDKIRLREQVEAERFARKVERDLGDMPGTMVGYKCKLCPRHPLTSDWHWHITHADRAERGKNGRGRRRGRGLGQTHISPAVMARLRLSTDPDPS